MSAFEDITIADIIENNSIKLTIINNIASYIYNENPIFSIWDICFIELSNISEFIKFILLLLFKSSKISLFIFK